MFRYDCVVIIVLFLFSCTGRRANHTAEGFTASDLIPAMSQDPAAILEAEPVNFTGKSLTEMRLDSMGLVDISEIDDRIAVRLVYATADNFVGEVLYEDLTRAYVLPEVAAKLIKAQDSLDSLHPGYRLLIYDAARPISVQKKMRKIAEASGKQYYVADPSKGGGLHNYGAAVDITVLDAEGVPLLMGTDYDHLGYEANIDKEKELVEKGIITHQELSNRLLLRNIMRQAGFTTVQSEWWHFNHTSRANAQRLYSLIDF